MGYCYAATNQYLRCLSASYELSMSLCRAVTAHQTVSGKTNVQKRAFSISQLVSALQTPISQPGKCGVYGALTFFAEVQKFAVCHQEGAIWLLSWCRNALMERLQAGFQVGIVSVRGEWPFLIGSWCSALILKGKSLVFCCHSGKSVAPIECAALKL